MVFEHLRNLVGNAEVAGAGDWIIFNVHAHERADGAEFEVVAGSAESVLQLVSHFGDLPIAVASHDHVVDFGADTDVVVVGLVAPVVEAGVSVRDGEAEVGLKKVADELVESSRRLLEAVQASNKLEHVGVVEAVDVDAVGHSEIRVGVDLRLAKGVGDVRVENGIAFVACLRDEGTDGGEGRHRRERVEKVEARPLLIAKGTQTGLVLVVGAVGLVLHLQHQARSNGARARVGILLDELEGAKVAELLNLLENRRRRMTSFLRILDCLELSQLRGFDADLVLVDDVQADGVDIVIESNGICRLLDPVVIKLMNCILDGSLTIVVAVDGNRELVL